MSSFVESILKEQAAIKALKKLNCNIFTRENEAYTLYKYTESIVEYIIKENIQNLILIDRSARPFYVAIKEYFKLKKPNKKSPNIYFVNPKGFIPQNLDNLSFSDLQNLSANSHFTQSGIYTIETRNEQAIAKEFSLVYKRLVLEKDKPLLIFDTCIHTGKNILAVKKILGLIGFKDIKISSVSQAELGSAISADFYLSGKTPVKKCWPFGFQNLVTKFTDTVTSARENSYPPIVSEAIEIRHEIKNIINYFSSLDPNDQVIEWFSESCEYL